MIQLAAKENSNASAELYGQSWLLDSYHMYSSQCDELFSNYSDASVTCVATIGTLVSMSAWFYTPSNAALEWEIVGQQIWNSFSMSEKKVCVRL